MFKTCDLKAVPIENTDWWSRHAKYAIFNRQGLDIVCALFEHPKPRANVVFLTGWNETFLKYSDLIRSVFEAGFSVFTYDHQSQGFSGRWLAEQQSTWMHSFADYVDDFVYFTTTISREYSKVPMYLISHSMGCLIAAIGMTRHPSLVNRAAFSSPMFRNKCGMKYFDMKMPFPQQLTYWITYCCCIFFGLGSMHALGYLKEAPDEKITVKLTTDSEELAKWEQLRRRYPEVISCCVTNDWVLHSIRAQNKFAELYPLFRTNCLIFQATDDVFVYTRAMAALMKKAMSVRLFVCPQTYHEVILERPEIRSAVLRAILGYFTQAKDDVSTVTPPSPLELYDSEAPLFTVSELVIRSVGLALAFVGSVVGLSMMFGTRRALGRIFGSG